MEKKHSYEVNLFIVFAPQRIPEGDNCIFAYQHYTKLPTMNVHVRALSSMAAIIYFYRVELVLLRSYLWQSISTQPNPRPNQSHLINFIIWRQRSLMAACAIKP